MSNCSHLARALEHAIAVGKLDRERVERLVEHVDQTSFPPVRFDWHTHGISARFAVGSDKAGEFVRECCRSWRPAIGWSG